MSECELYAPFLRFLNMRFEQVQSPVSGALSTYCQEIEEQTQAGRWSNPDILSMRFWLPELVPAFKFTVRSFELKATGQADITSVHQALAHRRYVHESFLAIHEPEWKSQMSYITDLRKQCSHHGLGFIAIENPENHESYAVLERARAVPPLADEQDQFLKRHLSREGANILKNWQRRIVRSAAADGAPQ